MADPAPPLDGAAGWHRPTPDATVERWFDGSRWTALERQIDEKAVDQSVPAAAPTVVRRPVAPPSMAPAPPPVPPVVVSADPVGRPDRSAAVPVAIGLLSAIVIGGIAVIIWLAVSSGSSTDTAKGVPATSVASAATTSEPTVATEQETTTSTQPTPPTPVTVGPLPPGCVDPGSASWPATTVGPVVTCPEYPAGRPSATEVSLAGPYVLVLDSVAVGEPGRVPSLIADWSARGVSASWVDSRSYPGLRDPYLVVVVDGFASAAAGRDFCASRGIPGNRCYPRNPFDSSDATTQPK